MLNNKNIKDYFKNFFLTHKRQPVLKEAHIRGDRMSMFLNNYGGMDLKTGIRLLVATDHKIVDALGNVIYGNPETRSEEINDNMVQQAAAPLDSEIETPNNNNDRS